MYDQKMNKKIAKGLLGFAVLLSCKALAVENFIYAGWESEPFYYNGAHGIQGAFYEIMTEICRLENLRCTFKVLEFRESIELLKKGEIQGGGPYVYTVPRASVLNFSDKIFSSTYGFFALPNSAKKILSYDDLRGVRVGVMALTGSRVSLEAVNEFVDGKLSIIEEKSIAAIMKKIENKKYPVGYTNRDSAMNWITRNKSSIKEIPGLGENLDYRIAFSQKSVSSENLKRLQDSFAELKNQDF